MRKNLIIALIALLTASLSAQTPGQGTGNLTPSSPKTTKTTPQPRGGTPSNTTAAKPSKLAPAQPAQKPANPPAASARSGQTTRTTTTSRQPATSTGLAPAARPTGAGSNATAAKTTTKPAAVKMGRKGRPIPSVPVKVNWMTLEEALEKSKTEKRKIFVDVYTDWCGWCRRMDDSTFADPFVAQYLNDHYYPVKFNAEQQKDIVFKDKTYHFRRNGARGTHELAIEWLNNRLSYPTVVFLDENFSVIQPLPGFLDPAKLEAILNYFGTNSHYTTPWDTYEKRFSEE
ncbi:MAG: DUF255 domain-containing protein [Saprospiraceae bacterium]|nr:DUF255 domain-containing protein [Saprospiraceae bacterium]